ncbi:hypothetical protein DYB32_008250 [Aphanomyces invadans]|nr:hypothetical protein DYB32_008250 [Aphanomyces invadans]
MHGGLSVNFYELEAYKVLAGLQHGSRVTDLRDFLLEQHQVQEVTWDQRTYHPKHASKLQAKPQKALKPSNSKLKSKKKRSKKDEL